MGFKRQEIRDPSQIDQCFDLRTWVGDESRAGATSLGVEFEPPLPSFAL